MRIKHLANLPCQRVGREGFLKESRTLVQDTMVYYGVVSVSRHIQHLHFWA